jgi:hypothetical protein
MWIEGKSKESSWWAKKTPVCYEVLSSEAQCKYFMRIIKKKKLKSSSGSKTSLQGNNIQNNEDDRDDPRMRKGIRSSKQGKELLF